MNNIDKKLIVITGPTGAGKTTLSLKLAKWIGGEIVSADSRQIYQKLNIGTDKIKEEETKGIPHHLLSIIPADSPFTAAEFKNLAKQKFEEIYKRKNIPILCGGTYFYISAVIDDLDLPKIEPDWDFRRKKEKKSTEELFNELEKKDNLRAKNIDRFNKRRLIRALEIIEKTKKPVKSLNKTISPYKTIIIGVKKEKEDLHKNIDLRVDKMIADGLKDEAFYLLKNYQIIAKETIGYKEWEDYFLGVKSYEKVIEEIKTATKQFSKRQNTWLKRDKRIIWVKDFSEAKKAILENL